MNLQASGIVFDIQRFCIHDGPGIRTTVFLKGCPLDCAWCHNPESKRMQPELSYRAAACTGCGRCVSACPMSVHSLSAGVHSVHFEACQACGRCVSACDSNALSIWGARKTVEVVMAIVEKDRAYYATSGGGLTLSGGEPLSQPAFASTLLAAARAAGLNTCTETSGYSSAEALSMVAAQTDLFLFDYKITGADAHRTYTGQENSIILRNLSWLLAQGYPVCLRCPIIPGINDTDTHWQAIARLSREAGIQSVEILPYHELGRGKAEATGKPYALPQTSVTDAQQAHWHAQLQSLGCQKLKETR